MKKKTEDIIGGIVVTIIIVGIIFGGVYFIMSRPPFFVDFQEPKGVIPPGHSAVLYYRISSDMKAFDGYVQLHTQYKGECLEYDIKSVVFEGGGIQDYRHYIYVPENATGCGGAHKVDATLWDLENNAVRTEQFIVCVDNEKYPRVTDCYGEAI